MAVAILCFLTFFLVIYNAQVSAVTTLSPPACSAGLFGPTCTSHCGHCQGTGCDKVSGVCPAGCKPGYKPSDPQCNIACSGGTWGQNCQRNCSVHCTSVTGCNTIDGSCTCQPGYLPPSCVSACSGGTWGQNCQRNCSVHCTSVTGCNTIYGTCSCQPGYKPPNCDSACSGGTWGQNCQRNCSVHCTSVTGCNTIYGTCTCQPGYQPPSCVSVCSDGTWGQNCQNNCSNYCVSGTVCNKNSGLCTCQPGYQPPLCDSACVRGRYGQNCVQQCGRCLFIQSPYDVTGTREACHNINGRCSRCDDNWEMPYCRGCVPGHWGYTCSQLCGQCGGDGRCDQNTGVCLSKLCLNGWASADCKTECADGTFGPNCTQQCGHCRNGNACRHDSGLCEAGCEDDYEGVLCDREMERLIGPVVGAIMGAAVLISIVVVSTWCYFKRRSNEKPAPVKKDFSPSNSLQWSQRAHNLDNQDVESETFRRQNYDQLQLNPVTDHATTATSPNHEPVYQNTNTTPTHTYGNVTAKSEAVYGNLQVPNAQPPSRRKQ